MQAFPFFALGGLFILIVLFNNFPLLLFLFVFLAIIFGSCVSTSQQVNLVDPIVKSKNRGGTTLSLLKNSPNLLLGEGLDQSLVLPDQAPAHNLLQSLFQLLLLMMMMMMMMTASSDFVFAYILDCLNQTRRKTSKRTQHTKKSKQALKQITELMLIWFKSQSRRILTISLCNCPSSVSEQSKTQ